MKVLLLLFLLAALVAADSRCTWSKKLLSKLGAKASHNNMVAMLGWMQGEGSPCHNNPLDTTEGWKGATDCNSVGVKNYPSVDSGVDATVATLKNGDYGSILSHLHDSSDPISTAQAIASSPWGTGDAVGATEYCQSNYNACCNDSVP